MKPQPGDTLTLARALNPAAPLTSAPPPDWSHQRKATAIAHLSRPHGLQGWVFNALQTADPQQNWFDRSELKAAEIERRRAQMKAWHSGRAFCTELEHKDIPATIFKGAVLSELLFDDLAIRDATDVDILIDPSDLPAAVKVAAAIGAEMDDRLRSAGTEQLMRLLKHRKDVLLILPDDTKIELHARPFLLCDFAAELRPDGRLSELLFYLLMHGELASWTRLKWALDTWLAAQKATETDWEEVRALARQHYCQPALARAMSFIHAIWGGEAMRVSSADKLLQSRLAALDHPEPKPRHRDMVFATSRGGDWLRMLRLLYLNPDVSVLETGPLRLPKQVGYVLSDLAHRAGRRLQGRGDANA